MKIIYQENDGKVILFCPINTPTLKQGELIYELTEEDESLLMNNEGATFSIQNGVFIVSEYQNSFPIRELSKLTIRRRLRDMGKEDEFDALLDSNVQARRDWDDAVTINTNDPMFTIQAPQFKTALGLTEEEFNFLIS